LLSPLLIDSTFNIQHPTSNIQHPTHLLRYGIRAVRVLSSTKLILIVYHNTLSATATATAKKARDNTMNSTATPQQQQQQQQQRRRRRAGFSVVKRSLALAATTLAALAAIATPSVFVSVSAAPSSSSGNPLAILKRMDYRYFVAGGTCAAFSHGITTPIDVVKTKLQADPKVSNVVQRNVDAACRSKNTMRGCQM